MLVVTRFDNCLSFTLIHDQNCSSAKKKRNLEGAGNFFLKSSTIFLGICVNICFQMKKRNHHLWQGSNLFIESKFKKFCELSKMS